MSKALILDGKVVDICNAEFDVHKNLTWVDATDAAEIGGTWDGTNFGPKDTRTDSQIAADKLGRLRHKRNKKLLEVDWWASSDLTMTDEQKKYRQDLRDITKTYSSLDDVKWPTKPE